MHHSVVCLEIPKTTDWGKNLPNVEKLQPKRWKSFLDSSSSSCSRELPGNTYFCVAQQIPNLVTSQIKLYSPTCQEEV